MSDIQHIDVDSDEFEGTPKALRDHVKRLQKALETEKQATVELRGQLQSTALADVLAGFAKPGRVKSALLSDQVDPLDTEAVQTWLKENGDDFARSAGAPATPPAGSPAEPNPYDAFSAVESFAQPADMSKVQMAIAGITPDMTREQVAEHFTRVGL